ncbi:hypothetical protein [Iodidimonas sp. SYSU 1G8]|uniref:hypothetical protein n=1 Tax=Iodidimonas sp. SYSU 1G8 TaxID=3133967 RepID=UPI0031FE95E8
MKRAVLTIALCLTMPVAALAVDDVELRNAPSGDVEPADETGGAPLNTSDGMTGDDYQEPDLGSGVGNKLSDAQCVAYARYLQQTQTTVEVQQNLKARGCI